MRVADVERVEEAVEHVGEEVVVVRGVEGLVGEAVAWEVDGDEAVGFGEGGDDVAVEVGGDWRWRQFRLGVGAGCTAYCF